jgi:hypothetical protein
MGRAHLIDKAPVVLWEDSGAGREEERTRPIPPLGRCPRRE